MPSSPFRYKKMFQVDSVELNFPPPPTVREFVLSILLSWFVGLVFMVFGIWWAGKTTNIWRKVLAVIISGFGSLFCFILGFSFTRINQHHIIAWIPDNREANQWIDLAIALTIWGVSLLLAWAMRKSHMTIIKNESK